MMNFLHQTTDLNRPAIGFNLVDERLFVVKQAGFSLFITLIALMVMSLASVALIRSVDTNTVISGNLAFKQSATASADAAVERAIAWLETNKGDTLNADIPNNGYLATAANGVNDQTGTAFWATIAGSACLMKGNSCLAENMADGTTYQEAIDDQAGDAAGNVSEYVIQRLCTNDGPRATSGCLVPETNPEEGADTGNNNGGAVDLGTAIYYRIIVSVTGPRNTRSFVQAVVSIS